MAGRLANITDYQKKKSLNKAEALPGNVPQKIEGASTLQSPSVTEGFQQMGEFKMEQPTLQKVNPNDVYASTRRQALGATSEADAEKGMEYWNASPKEYWTEKIKSDPDNTYYYTQQMLASDETPEEKRKRERREQLGEVFSGLGNLIGNAANLYYTHRGGQYIDLNTANEKHRERMQRLKDKQDALAEQQKNIILNAKLGEMKADRAERVAKDKLAADQAAKEKDNAFKLKFNAYLKELDNANKMGQIDAQTKANMQRDLAKAKNDKELEAIKAKYDKELEAFKQSNRIALKTTPSYGQDDIVESFTDTDGTVWTRTKPFSKAEKAEAFESLPMEVQQLFTTQQYDDDGNVTSRRVDYDGALGYAINRGMINDPEKRGFKKSKGDSGLISISGLGGNNEKSDKRPKI